MMKILVLLLLLTNVATVYAQQADYTQPTKPSDELHQELIARIKEFTMDWAMSDTAALSNLLAEEYRHGDIFGKIQHRKEWLEFAALPRQPLSEIEIYDDEILLYGNIAVITGIMPQFQLRFTQVWIKRNNHWMRAAFQGTIIEKPK